MSSMSMLPTPPRPSTIDKENWEVTSMSTTPQVNRKGIEWATNKEVFTYCPVSGRALATVATPRKPRRSILKPARPPLSFAEEKKRDVTPLPDDALENSEFLQHPVSGIVSKESTLRELTEAYSILAARIRASVPPNFFSSPTRDTRHALFDPLRRKSNDLATAIVRDLGRVFVDPFLPPNSPPSSLQKVEKSGLPTPQDSPTPKKGGMTEEQVKYARDLSTVANATIKFLTLAFQVPSIYDIFTEKQLSSILTAVLAIPLAESIRSPIARKICGFAITFLQCQRLPDSILSAAAPRIAYALKRAIEGELGREGKKGATAEAYKAVHDLVVYRPGIFIPIFQTYLGTLLDGLLTPSCALRVLAAHALGGFVLAITQSGHNFDSILRDVSLVVSEFLLRKEPQTHSQSTIIRSLRTALRTTEPTHQAQGPFWATSVLASFVILLGPALLKDRQLLIAFRGTIDIGLKTKKRTVRAITSTLWGPLIWVWQKWRASMDDASEEIEPDCEVSEQEKVKACFSTMIRMTTHLPIGISFIGALLGCNEVNCRREDLLLALYELGASARRGGESTQRALDLLDRLINSREDLEFYEHWTDTFLGKLVPRHLFSVSPGLLTQDVSTMANCPTVDNILAAQPTHTDVRPLSDDEKCLPGVWTRVKDAWIACIEQLEMSPNDVIPDVLVDIWMGLVRMGLLNIANDAVLHIEYACQCAEVLISIFTNKAIDLRDRAEDGDTVIASENTVKEGGDEPASSLTGPSSAANQRLKLMLVRTLWTAATAALPPMSLKGAVTPMIRFLVKHQAELIPSSVDESEDEDEALSEWSQFCAQVAAVAVMDITKLIWDHDWEWDVRTRARAWRGYARGWAEDSRGPWRQAAVILGVPFRENSPWDMSDADLSEWSSLLAYAVDMAAKDDVAAHEVLEFVSSCIGDQHIISMSSILRVADHLVGTFEKHIEDCIELPHGLIDLVHEILVTSYPPQPRNKIVATWLLRSLQTCISNCPASLIIQLLESLHDGICTWIADECRLFSPDEYSSEIIPLFQTVLVSLEALMPSAQILQSLSSLFASALQIDSMTGELTNGRLEALNSFTDFWRNNCQMLEPPKGGWADGILQARMLAFPKYGACKKDSVHSSTFQTAHGFIAIDSDEEDELNVLPRTRTPRRPPAHRIPLPPSPSPVRIHYNMLIPSTPPRKSGRQTEESPKFKDVPRLPSLFNSLSSPKPQGSLFRRTSGSHRNLPRTVSGSSTSSAASAEADKENINPQPRKDANEVIHLASKHLLPEVESSPSRAKRARTESNGSDDSEDARAVEAALFVGDHPLTLLGRFPLENANVNVCSLPRTPSKRSSAASSVRTPVCSPAKRQKVQSSGKPLQRMRIADCISMDEDVEDDEYLPSSSEIESEEENGPSSSSSPVGPFTPRVIRQAEFTVAITRDPASDDVTSSSPTRNIRRMARAQGVLARTKTANVKPKNHSALTRTFTSSILRD